jgi:hypothetical protein
MPKTAQQPQKYSMQVLEEAVPRAAKLLNAIGAEPVIRTLMAQVGMTEADIDEGGQLLVACWHLPPGTRTTTDTDDAKAQRAAVAELNQWDEPNFNRVQATLGRHYPSARDYVFHKLAASDVAAEAVTGVGTFLSRLDALEKGTAPARADSKKDDKKAVELLAARGLDKKERARLSALVEVALKPTATLPEIAAETEERATVRIQALTALKDWYEEWAANARTVVKKRNYLIRLGLASRKVRKGEAPDGAAADDSPK